MRPRLLAHRFVHPAGHASLEHITLHPQLGILLSQPGHLRPLVLTGRALTVLLTTPVGVDPVAQRASVHTKLPSYCSVRTIRLAHQPDRALFEIVIKLPACL